MAAKSRSKHLRPVHRAGNQVHIVRQFARRSWGCRGKAIKFRAAARIAGPWFRARKKEFKFFRDGVLGAGMFAAKLQEAVLSTTLKGVTLVEVLKRSSRRQGA